MDFEIESCPGTRVAGAGVRHISEVLDELLSQYPADLGELAVTEAWEPAVAV